MTKENERLLGEMIDFMDKYEARGVSRESALVEYMNMKDMNKTEISCVIFDQAAEVIDTLTTRIKELELALEDALMMIETEVNFVVGYRETIKNLKATLLGDSDE